MRLSLAMKEPQWRVLLQRLSWEEFLEWQAFDQVEPIGGARHDWNAAAICAMVMNTMLMRVGSSKRITVEECVLKFGEPKEVKKEAPAEPAWKRLKFIAQMHTALSKVRKRK